MQGCRAGACVLSLCIVLAGPACKAAARSGLDPHLDVGTLHTSAGTTRNLVCCSGWGSGLHVHVTGVCGQPQAGQRSWILFWWLRPLGTPTPVTASMPGSSFKSEAAEWSATSRASLLQAKQASRLRVGWASMLLLPLLYNARQGVLDSGCCSGQSGVFAAAAAASAAQNALLAIGEGAPLSAAKPGGILDCRVVT